MPRLHRRGTRPGPEVTLRTAMALMIGCDWSFLTPKGQPVNWERTPESVLHEAWAVIGEALTVFVSQTFPGHRPVGWWRFAAVQARRHVRQGGVCVDPWVLPHAQALRLEEDDEDSDEDLECSCRYLGRLHLLSPAELIRVQATAWPGCKEENEDAWRAQVITCTDLREWLQREYGTGEEE